MLHPGIQAILAAVRVHGPDTQAYKALGNIYAARQDDLLIFNYTPLAVFGGVWNDVELVSRGLIVHWPTATLCALPFPKFFNVDERPETRLDALPAGPFEVTEKLDGSLAILFRTPDGPTIATRGSFSSPQARWATAHLRAHHDLSGLPEDVTLLFEIIYPDNPEGPVLRYGATEALFLIGARRLDGHDYGYDELERVANRYAFRLPRRLVVAHPRDLLPLRATEKHIEGWVVRFANGLRVKVKTEDYLWLQRLATECTPARIRDRLLLDAASWDEFLLNLPDELQREAGAHAARIRAALDVEEARIRAIFSGPLAPYAADVAQRGPTARKAYALAVSAAYAADAKYLFALLDGKDIRPSLLRALELDALPPAVTSE